MGDFHYKNLGAWIPVTPFVKGPTGWYAPNSVYVKENDSWVEHYTKPSANSPKVTITSKTTDKGGVVATVTVDKPCSQLVVYGGYSYSGIHYGVPDGYQNAYRVFSNLPAGWTVDVAFPMMGGALQPDTDFYTGARVQDVYGAWGFPEACVVTVGRSGSGAPVKKKMYDTVYPVSRYSIERQTQDRVYDVGTLDNDALLSAALRVTHRYVVGFGDRVQSLLKGVTPTSVTLGFQGGRPENFTYTPGYMSVDAIRTGSELGEYQVVGSVLDSAPVTPWQLGSRSLLPVTNSLWATGEANGLVFYTHGDKMSLNRFSSGVISFNWEETVHTGYPIRDSRPV